MKHKTDALEGDLLDAAVLIAEGHRGVRIINGRAAYNGRMPIYASPSKSWRDAGPIIEREKILLEEFDRITEQWRAIHPSHWNGPPYASAWGPTALIAAMRAFAKAKLGDEVEIP